MIAPYPCFLVDDTPTAVTNPKLKAKAKAKPRKNKSLDEDDSYIIEITDYNDNETFNGPLDYSYDFPKDSFKSLLMTFDKKEIYSIQLFAVHHKISLEKAICYKLLCHCCGNKLQIFGTNVCSIWCMNRLLRYSNTCIHGSFCSLCTGNSMLLLKKETVALTNKLVRNLFRLKNNEKESVFVDLEVGLPVPPECKGK